MGLEMDKKTCSKETKSLSPRPIRAPISSRSDRYGEGMQVRFPHARSSPDKKASFTSCLWVMVVLLGKGKLCCLCQVLCAAASRA